MKNIKSVLKSVARVTLGAFMTQAGIGHLTFARDEFQAQVPESLPLDKDFVVLSSGVVEIGFGLSMLFWKEERPKVGAALALFYTLIFPGNIAQYVNKKDSFGLDTDAKRFGRLFFQPVLIALALWSTGGDKLVKQKYIEYKK